MTTTVSHTAAIAAPADRVLGLLEDVTVWPQHLSDVVHAERTPVIDGHDSVRIWGLAPGDRVKVLRSDRTIDRAAGTITFVSAPGGPTTGGRWTVVPGSDGCQVTVDHEVVAEGDAADRVAAHSAEQLAEIKATAENRDLDQLVISFEDPLYAAGSAADAYELLYEADKWPERLPHVASLTMTEEVANIQFFDMDTVTVDGRDHTTRSVRVCFPHELIVYKQIFLPPLLDAHTGHWRFTETPEGTIVSSRHTATIKPSKLDILGEGTTVADARRYLRRVLSTNSMGNLQLAKQFTEERAGV